MWSAAEFAERGLSERLPLVARHAPSLAEPIRDFYDRYRHDHATYPVIVHGDLVPEHVLLNEPAERLAGIIDFGDVALGDPAQDFSGFWSYGEDATSRLVELSGLGQNEPGLRGRSRNHFVRYAIDRLFEKLSDGARNDAFGQMAKVERLLSTSKDDQQKHSAPSPVARG